MASGNIKVTIEFDAGRVSEVIEELCDLIEQSSMSKQEKHLFSGKLEKCFISLLKPKAP